MDFERAWSDKDEEDQVEGDIIFVEKSRYRMVFDIKAMPPKWAITLIHTLKYDIPTLKIEIVSMNPRTNTVMDYEQWANRIGHIVLDSQCVDEFNDVKECDKCSGGGACCEAILQCSIRNESAEEELPVYSDDLVTMDDRVKPVYRTFSLVAIYATEEVVIDDRIVLAVSVETDVPHTFDEGDLVVVLDSMSEPKLPKYCKAYRCRGCFLMLVELSLRTPFSLLPIDRGIDFNSNSSEMVGHITKRQLLYYLGPNENISFNAHVRRGTGLKHIKWSPIGGQCSYRPLYRDNIKVDQVFFTSDLTEGEREEFIAKVCPKGVFEIEESGKLLIERPDECDGCNRCVRWAEDKKPGAITFDDSKMPTWHRFTVESNGSLDAYDIVMRAFNLIQERLTSRFVAANEQLMYPKLLKKV